MSQGFTVLVVAPDTDPPTLDYVTGEDAPSLSAAYDIIRDLIVRQDEWTMIALIRTEDRERLLDSS